MIFSSHILSDVERIADRVAILHRGRLLIERPLDELKEQVRRLRLMFAGAPPERLELSGLLSLRRAGNEMRATVIGYDEMRSRASLGPARASRFSNSVWKSCSSISSTTETARRGGHLNEDGVGNLSARPIELVGNHPHGPRSRRYPKAIAPLLLLVTFVGRRVRSTVSSVFGARPNAVGSLLHP